MAAANTGSIYQAHQYPVNIDWGIKGDTISISKDNPLSIEKIGGNWETIYSLQTFNAKDYQSHAVQFKFVVEKTLMSQIVVGIVNHRSDQISNNWFIAKPENHTT